ncbi:carboxypeptidase-like regulatory domain-containing protein [Pedobacter sp.]|uniref:carboxypeptidase-like regulatory domain-containing protein n=1 Tax=Pedobacter sp. TaxID=1411316 RepID=UPI003BA9CD2C
MYKSIFALLFIFLFSVDVFSQNTFSISGKVKDDQGGLPGAGVYLSGYKLATVADNDGNFLLPNLKPGSYNILVQMVGYLPFSKSVIIEDKSVKVDLVLKENTVLLNEVTIRADPNRQKYIKQFTEYFIGTTPNSKQCKILNPQVLIVDFDFTKSLLTVKTTEFLIVENKALGYKLKYMLDYFEYNSRTRIIYFSGHPFFEEFKASPAKKKKYIEAREIAYYGSSQHFFRSLYENKSKEEGFIINKIIQTPNPNRYPENLINENLVKIRTLPEKTGIRKEAGKIDVGLLEFWTKQKEMPRFIDKFSRAEVNPDTLVRYFNENLKWMNYTDALCVQYTKEKESLAYSNTGFWVFRPLDIPEHELSVVKLTDGPVRFYANGSVYDSRSMLYEGYWAYEKVGDMVPMDYIPIARK